MPPVERWTVRLAAAATGDFQTILQWTARRFGERQARLNADTLQEALKALVDGPSAIGCRPREDIAPGIFTLHGARQGRRGRHFILFKVSRETGTSRHRSMPRMNRRQTGERRILSSRRSLARCRDVVEESAVAVQNGGMPGDGLPARHRDIDVTGIKFEGEAAATGALGSDQGGAGAGERLT